MGFFENGNSTDLMEGADVNELQKALSAGYGTDSANFTNGRALIPENLETEVMNVLAMAKEDCKMMASLKTQPVRSTVHEKNIRDDEGDFKHLSVTEGGASVETSQSIKRKTFDMKYLQVKRGVTKQMEAAETFEDALASEKVAGVNSIIKGAEYLCFHGDSAIVPTEFDGFESQIRKAAAKEQNILSLRGATIGSKGMTVFDEMAEKIYSQGGSADRVYFPPVLAREIRDTAFGEKGYYNMGEGFNMMNNFQGAPLPGYNTAVGSILKLAGNDAGADKFYHVKGRVREEGDALKRPAAPATVTVSANASVANSEFASGDAGDYTYTVHAVNQYGISAGTTAAAPVTVAANGSVTVTITPGAGNVATGFIICRSAKDGTDVMEMDKVPNSGEATTVYTDLNKELPGTASMLFLTESKLSPTYKFGQLLPACTFPLYPTASAELPFLVLMFGGLEVYAPKFCGIVKDIHYNGGLY